MNRIVIAAAFGLGALVSSPLSAQDFYAGFGVGSEVRRPGDSRVYGGELGLRFAGPLGVRLEGFETVGLFFLGPSMTYSPMEGARLEPYLLGGAGGTWTVGGFVDPWLQAGGGLYWPIVSRFGLWGEGTAIRLGGDRTDDRLLLTARVGVRLYPFGRR